MKWSKAVLATLRADYERAIEALAEKLRPRFESGALRGWRDGDGNRIEVKGKWNPPLWKLEAECRKVFCGTEGVDGGDDMSTYLALALTPSGPATYDSSSTPEGNVGNAAAFDVLRVALAREWWKPEPGEMPTSKELGTLALVGWGSAQPRRRTARGLRARVLHCIERFRVALALAEVAANGAEPLDGAEHIVGAVEDDLRADIAAFRSALKEV